MAAARELITQLCQVTHSVSSPSSTRPVFLFKYNTTKLDQYQRSSRQMCYRSELLDITALLKVFVQLPRSIVLTVAVPYAAMCWYCEGTPSTVL